MAAATVSAKVRSAHRARILLVALESSIVGLSTGIGILAVGSLVRIDPGDPQTAILLALVGSLSGLSWWMERSADAAAVARSIDRRSGWRGALTTAFEVESAAIATPVAAALAREIAPLVSPRRFLASEARSSAAVLAAPFLALAFLGAVREGLLSREEPGAPAARSGARASAVLDRAADLRARARSLPGAAPAQDAALRPSPSAPARPRPPGCVSRSAGRDRRPEAEFSAWHARSRPPAPGRRQVRSATGKAQWGRDPEPASGRRVMQSTIPPAPVRMRAIRPRPRVGSAPRAGDGRYDASSSGIEARRAASVGRPR
jgi:hypothetical protein